MDRKRTTGRQLDDGSPGGAGRPEAGPGLEDLARKMAEISVRNEQLFRRLVEDERRFRRLARAVWKVQEDERRRLALELHDGIGQTLTALINHLRRASENGAGLEKGIDLAEMALVDVRELSRLLRPAVLDDLGLQAGLAWLVRMLRERAGLETSLDWRLPEDAALGADLETLLFRIAQEGLNNVVKHSGGTAARLSLGPGPKGVLLEISDEGRGFEPLAALSRSGQEGLGLRGIRDRVELFGGRLDIDAGPGRGCRLRVAVPVEGS